MLDRISLGQIPEKHHTALRTPAGALRYEHCLTRQGFEGPYTIIYHQARPHELKPARVPHGFALPSQSAEAQSLLRRHFRIPDLEAEPGPPVDVRIPLLFNRDVVLSASCPTADDPVYFLNADADELYFILSGGGTLRSLLGDLRFEQYDYVCVPKGIPFRFMLDSGVEQRWLVMEFSVGLGLLGQWRNAVGQLRMDAPYCHRDFRRPELLEPQDDGIRHILVRRGDALHGFEKPHSVLDAVGFDGSVYPWAFPILKFQPRVGQVHLPPTWHGTFAARGALICSFVPRPVDFHPQAVPCPYPHSSVDVDEVIFYCSGSFTSRKGVGPGSLSLHPAGVPHGPHPGAYESSIGTTRTDELAVMLDVASPLWTTPQALSIEDAGYHESFHSP